LSLNSTIQQKPGLQKAQAEAGIYGQSGVAYQGGPKCNINSLFRRRLWLMQPCGTCVGTARHQSLTVLCTTTRGDCCAVPPPRTLPNSFDCSVSQAQRFTTVPQIRCGALCSDRHQQSLALSRQNHLKSPPQPAKCRLRSHSQAPPSARWARPLRASQRKDEGTYTRVKIPAHTLPENGSERTARSATAHPHLT
jgi:hypothetical protein